MTERLDFPIRRSQLDNGLRMVLSPDTSAPTVAVAVHYDVGFRSEPQGRTGFAHLFEHMMFQGSENLGKMEHVHQVQGNGGTLNGTTTPDYTNYFEALPSSALELGLFLEADRMRSLALTEENLQNQIAVVKEEVRVNVLNQPYGGFPWIHLSPLLFDTYPNAHNGYGSFEDLESATGADARDFFRRYYSPGNALLTVVGDFDPRKATRLIRKHFAGIPGRRPPRRPRFAEPLPGAERTGRHRDAHAPTPAVAFGYRAPDPVADLEATLALAVTGELLASGEVGTLRRRLVRDEGLATSVNAWLGVFGGAIVPFERDPTRFQILVYYPDPASLGRIVAAVDEEVDALAAGIDPGAAARVAAEAAGDYLRRIDGFLQRALTIAPLELFHGRAELVNELPARLASLDPSRIAAAVGRWLRPENRAVLELVPGS